MKTLLITLSLVLTSFSSPNSMSFCRGWEQGWCYGWQAVKGDFYICPLAPLCPMPPLNCTYDDYRCGFALGVVAGERAARGW